MLHRRLRYVLLALLLPTAPLAAQTTVVGTVTDSVGHHPLAGALVQLASSGSFVKSTNTDSLGSYRIDSVPPGKYLLGFFHPTLDSLGIDVSPKQVTVVAAGEQHVDLAIPPAQRIAAQLCHDAKGNDSTGLLIGQSATPRRDNHAPDR